MYPTPHYMSLALSGHNVTRTVIWLSEKAVWLAQTLIEGLGGQTKEEDDVDGEFWFQARS